MINTIINITEKPTAMNAEEARQMLDSATKFNKIHMIDHELRFNPNRKKIKEWISNNEIGFIRHINILFYNCINFVKKYRLLKQMIRRFF